MTEKNVLLKTNLEATPASTEGVRTKLRRRSTPVKNTAALREALNDIDDLPRTVNVPGLDPAALEIGQLVRRARATAGMTQIDLAKAAGLTQGALSDIELGKGKDGPTYRILRELWRALNPKASWRESFATNFLLKPKLLDVATLAERNADVSALSASADSLVKLLLDQKEVSRVCSMLLAAMDPNSIRASRKYDPMMWRIAPHARTRIATHDLTVFVGVSGILRINAKRVVDKFDHGYIVRENETVEVTNAGARPLSFLSAPAAWFVSTQV